MQDQPSKSGSSFRQRRYQRFHKIVEEVVEEIQNHRWEETGKPKNRLSGESLRKLTTSVATIIRDSVAVVYQRKRKGEALIRLSRNWYSSELSPPELSHRIHVYRAYRGMLEMGYLEETNGNWVAGWEKPYRLLWPLPRLFPVAYPHI